MSLVTRCTTCGTLFKVVADQLKISEGWVRCGQCGQVFDAQNHLVEEAALVANPPKHQSAPMVTALWAPTAPQPVTALPPLGAPPSQSAPPSANAPALNAPPVSARQNPQTLSLREEIEQFKASKYSDSGFLAEMLTKTPAPAGKPVSSSTSPSTDSLSSQSFADTPVSRLHPEDSQEDKGPPSSQAFQPGKLRKRPAAPPSQQDAGPTSTSWTLSDQSAALGALGAAGASRFPADEPDGLPPDSTPAELDTSPTPLPGFVAQAQAAQRWRSPWMRAGLSLLSLALLAVLLLQIALHQRDAIAAIEPRSRPLLEQLCAQAGCVIAPLKMIDAIVIDASSFNKSNKEAQGDGRLQNYRLSLTLKNAGSVPVAVPHIELSLQDAQDSPILRRVLSPAELGFKLSELPAGADTSANLNVQIDTAQLGEARVSGYRVYAFYP